MIICRTPFRISFFGGGTDYPIWYRNYGGSVLSTTIDKYCYITLRRLPPFFDHNIRLVYSRIENCGNVDEIEHPSVRETLRYMGCLKDLEIHHDGDLPARSGIGSSSSFTVGLLNALANLKGYRMDRRSLAKESIHIEQDLIGETVGSQDQVAAAFGGLNHITFGKRGEIDVQRVLISTEKMSELESCLMLFYTKINRFSSEVAQSYVPTLNQKKEILDRMHQMVGEGLSILQGDRCISGIGTLLHKAWIAKSSLSSKVSSPVLNSYYRRAIDNGAIGGKITGAGGGGFLLLFVPPEAQQRIKDELKDLVHVPFNMESQGSRILFNSYKDKDSKTEGAYHRECFLKN